MSRYVAAGVLVDGVAAHVLHRLLRAPRNRELLDGFPAWLRLELAPVLDGLARAAAAYEVRPVAVGGTAATATAGLEAQSVTSDAETLTTTEAALLLGLKSRQVRNLAAAGLGRRVGDRWLFDRGAVVALAEVRGVRDGHPTTGRSDAA